MVQKATCHLAQVTACKLQLYTEQLRHSKEVPALTTEKQGQAKPRWNSREFNSQSHQKNHLNITRHPAKTARPEITGLGSLFPGPEIRGVGWAKTIYKSLTGHSDINSRYKRNKRKMSTKARWKGDFLNFYCINLILFLEIIENDLRQFLFLFPENPKDCSFDW